MDNLKGAEENLTVSKLREGFPEATFSVRSFRNETTLLIKPGDLIRICRHLKEDPGLLYDFLSDLTAVDRFGDHPRSRWSTISIPFSTNGGSGSRCTLRKVRRRPASRPSGVPPIGTNVKCSICSAFALRATPISDGFSCRRSGRDVRSGRTIRCRPRRNGGKRGRQVTERRTMTINMGPQHPSTHGVLRLVLELDGEIVVRCTPHIGYLHTGMEKIAESKRYQQVIPITDRMDYLAPLSNNLAYVLAVEKLLGIEVPPRAQVIRVMLTELTRIASHLVWLATHAIDIGAMSVFLYAFREREAILDMYEQVSGARMMSSYFRIGGLFADLPEGSRRRSSRLSPAFPTGWLSTKTC